MSQRVLTSIPFSITPRVKSHTSLRNFHYDNKYRIQLFQACELLLQPREWDLPDIQRVRKCWWKTRNASLALKQLPSGKYQRHDVIHLLLGLQKNETNESDYVNGLLGVRKINSKGN